MTFKDDMIRYLTNKKALKIKAFLKVDATGFEPATSASRTQRSTKLSHASLFETTVDNNTIKKITCQLTNKNFLNKFSKNFRPKYRGTTNE